MHLTDLKELNLKFDRDIEFKEITEDSRKVKKGDIFVAIKGSNVDGEKFVDQAIKNGAVAVISSKKLDKISVPVILVDNPRLIIAKIAARLYAFQPGFIAAITGTNGKTSTVNYCRQIFSLLGKKSASIGTIGVLDGDGKNLVEDFSMTTPDSVKLHSIINNFSKEHIDYLSIEASSHGLDQYRLDGLKIKTGAFTNLTRDHLDYHLTLEAYFKAKTRLFSEVMPEGSNAILNADSEYFVQLKKICKDRGHKIISFGREGEDIKLNVFDERQIVNISINNKKYEFPTEIVGDFMISNLMCAIGIAISAGFRESNIIEILPKVRNISGRLEKIQHPNGSTIFVDYAHTPDALEKALRSLRLIARKKLVVVFGCGGNRDKGKRFEMGKIAAESADLVIVTDDNPREEDAAQIRKEILAGAGKEAKEISSREEAIRTAVRGLVAGDVLLVAGKGHEKYQIIGKEVLPFDDVEIINSSLG